MRLIRERFVSSLGPSLFLAVIAAASVGLNTDLSAPPRFDGAGYAILGEALASGRGYREISEPGSPRHDHFPPGYPAALALLWQFTGRSVVAAHAFSVFCTVAAVLLAWQWFRAICSRQSALMLGLALALNWTWGRVGGSIQSEPFYMVWELLAVLAAVHAGRRDSTGAGLALGVTLAACTLVRHVGVCLLVAVVLDLGLRRRWKALLVAVTTSGALILPWVGWLAMVHHHTQIGLLTRDDLPGRIFGQAVFYVQRLPDQITGPFVEVGTVLHRSPAVAVAGNLWAMVATSIVVWGWVRAVRAPRRRLAGMIPFSTLALLLVWPFTEAGRFLIPLVPFLLVGLTEGLASAIARAGLRRPRDWAAGLALAISVPYAAYSIINGRADAQRRIHADFDAACQWIDSHATHIGPIMTRHPGEVFWQIGRQAVAPESPDPGAIDEIIARLGVAYLLIDEDRYVNAALNPLQQYVKRYPDRVVPVWSAGHGSVSVRVFETRHERRMSGAF